MAASPKKCIFIQGPTGTGKNALAMRFAEKKSGVLINVDSVQIYKNLLIGANSPTANDKLKVRHELYNVLDPDQAVTAGQYKRMVEKLIKEKTSEQLMIFVGGSNFYFRALEKGMPVLKEISSYVKHKVSEMSKQYDNKSLWEELRKKSPKAADKLHFNDRYRVERALTLVLSQDKSPSELELEIPDEAKPLHGFEVIKVSLYLERDELKVRLEDRVHRMFSEGLITEVKSLLDRFPEDSPALSTIGYKEVVAFIHGKFTKEEAIEAIVKNSMYLAKRQMTWLKKDLPRQWFHAIKEREKAYEFLMTT